MNDTLKIASCSLTGRTVLVTGASRSIGAKIVEVIASRGAKVLFTYRKKNEAINLMEKMNELGYDVKGYYFNYFDEDNLRFFVSELIEVHGFIHALVNNAAINHKKSILEYSEKKFLEILKVNTVLPYLFIKYISRHMIGKGIAGSIVNISSIRGEYAQINRVGYCSSKAGLNMIGRCSAYELSKYNIRVNTVQLGLTRSGMNDNVDENEFNERVKKIPLSRAGLPSDYGKLCAFLISIESDWITGQTITIDGGHTLVTF
jgi:3-oxoacyl-[acyl-carrier protein] reductase